MVGQPICIFLLLIGADRADGRTAVKTELCTARKAESIHQQQLNVVKSSERLSPCIPQNGPLPI